METFYTIIIILIFALAVADLVVGVSNDAVNFLNSAIGSKAIPMRTILAVAGVRCFGWSRVLQRAEWKWPVKGFFMPELYYFDEIIIIFSGGFGD